MLPPNRTSHPLPKIRGRSDQGRPMSGESKLADPPRYTTTQLLRGRKNLHASGGDIHSDA